MNPRITHSHKTEKGAAAIMAIARMVMLAVVLVGASLLASSQMMASDQQEETGHRLLPRNLRPRDSHPRAAATRSTQSAVGENHLSKYPTKGKINGVVILVEFPNRTFDGDIDQQQYFEDFMMKPGFNDLGSYGSVHDYFIDNSMGQFDPQFDVFGPVMMPEPSTYYGKNNDIGNDKLPQEMIISACQLLDDEIDFAKYDNDGDGYIDLVHVIYAGEGENNTKVAEDIWPHSWSVLSASNKQKVLLDDKILDDYVCTCELYDGDKDGIGVFCHEYCHALGLPDVYNTGGNNYVNGSYDMMDEGLYLGSQSGNSHKEGRCPAALTAYERYELGWLKPDLLIGNKYINDLIPGKDTIQMDEHLSVIVEKFDTVPRFTPDTLPCLITENRALILPVRSNSDDPRDGEYYLFENRQQTGWDTYIPGHGLLVWHIDYDRTLWTNNKVNQSDTHLCIDLVEADERASAGSANYDPFPGPLKSKTKFTATTKPALLGWDMRATGSGKSQPLNNMALTNIHETIVSYISRTEPVVVFSATDDGPDHYFLVGIENVWQDGTKEDEKSSRPQRIWRDGQLLIVTPAGTFDLQGHRIE